MSLNSMTNNKWKPTSGKEIVFHQDQPYFNFMSHKEEVTVWIALTPASPDNGFLTFTISRLSLPRYLRYFTVPLPSPFNKMIYFAGTLEYARGSHKWPINAAMTQDVLSLCILPF
jgi:hypothetical protein